jgi:urease accessory protein
MIREWQETSIREDSMRTAAPVAIASLIATPVFAHTGVGDPHGFLHGLAHPLLGADHLLAMLAVGLWSGFSLTKRVWAGAGVFLAAMSFGAGLAWAGGVFSGVEAVVLASVVVFGLLTMISRRGQSFVLSFGSLAAIAVFALAHGHAHAIEATGDALAYLAGFLITTAGLHLCGITLARMVAKRPYAQRALGAGVTLSGLWLMVG